MVAYPRYIPPRSLGVPDGETLVLKVNTPQSSITFDDVLVRAQLKPGVVASLLSYSPVRGSMEVHLDPDEGNACMLQDAVSYELYRRDASGGELTLVCVSAAKPPSAARQELHAREEGRARL